MLVLEKMESFTRTVGALLWLVASLPALCAIAPDAELLLAFKNGLQSPGVLANSWLASNVDSAGCPQQWYGLELTEPNCRVTALSLTSLSLSGEVTPATLGGLSQLMSLSLSNNLINGSLPNDLGTLTLLQNMDFAHNFLEGPIPDSFGALQSLVNISLAGNALSGSIAPVLELQQLESLNLSANALTGTLQFNSTLVQTAKLKGLDLSNNQLAGAITPLLASLPFLSLLNLSSNSFSGIIPPELGRCSSLISLDLSRNKLSGPTPTMDLMEALATLRLSDNALIGFVPQQLLDDRAPLLQELDLTRNSLSGMLGQITSSTLKIVKLASNRLEGPLPAKLGSCVAVDLSSNLFSGNIPLGGWTSNLEMLNLSNNSLTGLLDPEAFKQLFRLTSLDVSFNQLVGSIPSKLFTSQSVTQLVLSNNGFTGSLLSLPSQMMAPLQILDLSDNRLTGQIPSTIGGFPGLQVLNLSANQLSGSIPWQLSKLSLLQVLDVSINSLSGPVPAMLPAGLKWLNVSYNNLAGTIPARLVTLFSNSSFYPGNPHLLWPITPAFPDPSSQGVQVSLRRGRKRTGLAVKVGLIGGCTVGAALVIACLLVYYRNTSRSARSPKLVNVYRDGKPDPDFNADNEHGEPLPSVQRGAAGRNVSVATVKAEVKLDGLDLQKSEESPVRAKWQTAAAVSSDDDSSQSAEHPMVLKVRSPDRLAGDLFFLDASLLFTAEELSRAPAEVLGRSSHGTSYRATLDNGHVLTVKWLREGLAKSKKDFTREAKKFGGIKHPNVVSLRGYYWGPREHEKLLLSDHISAGSLAAHLYDTTGCRHQSLTWEQRLQVAVGVASGLAYLHGKQGVAHGNLKASNVLLQGPQLQARVADYCLHRLMTAAGTANQILNAGALGYRSPELASTRKPKPSLAADVYALGVILLELLTGKGAGDIMSANCGAVDLPDWVRLVANQGRPVDCFDSALVGIHRDQDPPKGMHEVLTIGLSCMVPQAARPNIQVVYEQLAAVLPS